MSDELGLKLAQMATEKKRLEDEVVSSQRAYEAIKTEKTTQNRYTVAGSISPHVAKYNQTVEPSLRIRLESSIAAVHIQRPDHQTLLLIEVDDNAAMLKRVSGSWSSSDDYLQIKRDEQGLVSYESHSARPPISYTSDEFAELVLMIALGLKK